MKKFFTLCLLVLTGIIAVAQQGMKLQVLTPPPPDVSALGKFGLVPVDNFTGVPSISIPIYTIKDGTLEFPVSLQYHAGGVKVKEEASEVGLGWALSAAGSIVSVTRGHPDFAGAPNAPGFANTYMDMPDPPNMQGNKLPDYSLNEWYFQWKNDLISAGNYGGNTLVRSGLTLNKNGVTNQYVNRFTFGYDGQAPDFASDLYIITIGNRSYKFIFDNNFKPVVLGDGSLKIELTYNGTYPDWKVTDESGTAYYFEKRQFYYSNNSYPANSGTGMQLNTWHLTRIVSPTHGEITFTYLHSNSEFISPVPSISQTYLVGNTSPHTQQYTNKLEAHYTMYQQLNIESIQFSLGNMKFFYDPVRLDLMGGKRLQAIEVRDKNDQLVKKLILDNNHYFTASSGTGGEYPNTLLPVEFTLDKTTKRLRLNAVSEVDVANPAKEKKYTFTYNNALNLPSKLSYSIDHWGYYNGAANTELVPPATVYLSTTPTALEFSGANRNANPDYMQANMLTAVQYPTSGTTNFTYETNRFTRTETEIIYQDEVSALYKAAGSATVNTSGFVDVNGNFTVASGWVGKKLKIVSIVTRNSSYPPDPYTLDIVVMKNGVFLKRIPVSTVIGTSTDMDESIILEAGNYNISYDAATTDFFNSCEIRRNVYVLKASSTTQQVQKTVYTGGLRTSKIRNTDPVSGNVNTKTYTYSNGVEDDLPVYESAEGYDTEVLVVPPPNSAVIVNENYFRYRYGQSIYPFSDGRSSPYFGYQKVEVRDIDNSNNANGLSEYSYSISGSININTIAKNNSILDHPKIINPIMAPIPDIPSGDRGQLNSEKHYKLVNGVTVPISSTTYYYTRDNSVTIWQMLFNQGLSDILVASINNLEQEFRIRAHHFPIPVLRNMLRRKEYSVYDAAGNVSLSQFEDYTYDNLNGHYQLIKKSTKNSKGDELNTWYKYPQDYGDLATVPNLDQESQGIRLLQQTHVVTPLEIYNEKVQAVSAVKTYLGGQLNVFNTNLPTPKQILSLETATPLTAFTASTINNGVFSKNSQYKSRIRFTQYDANGRLLEQNKENDVPQSYIWGYNQQYPVAEVVNAKSNEIFHDNFEELAGWNGNLTAYDNSKSKTGKYSGRIDKPTSGELYSHSTKWLTISLPAAKKFKYSVWVYSTGPSAEIFLFMRRPGDPVGASSSFDQVATGETNKWVLLEKEVTVPADVIQLNMRVDNNGGGTVWFDDVRLHPSDAMMTTYTYTPLVGMTSQTDVNNRSTFYEYDSFNRLSVARDNEGKILKKICYNYAGQVEDCSGTTFNNVVKSGSFTKNNCGGGATGSSVTYTVAASTYSAATQFAADSLAQNDVNTNGQAYANANGTCVFSSVDYSGTYYSQYCENGQAAQPVYVSVPAGSYTSTISQQDANDQAYQYAQDYANTNGTCVTGVELNYTNYTGEYMSVILTDVVTSEQFYFEMSPSGGGMLGSVPEAVYHVEINSYNWWGNYGFSAGCGHYSYGSSAYFYNVTINGGCNEFFAYY